MAILFLAYSYFGQGWLIPDLIAHEGRSFSSLVNHASGCRPRGVIRHPRYGVSTAFVFLIRALGALLDKGGVGNYFIQWPRPDLANLRGGAVPRPRGPWALRRTGLISGSSIANVVIGPALFTIPLDEARGFFRAKKAGRGG